MSNELKILLMGHSHAGAVSLAYRQYQKDNIALDYEMTIVRLNQPTFQPNFEQVNQKRVVSENLEKRLRHIPKSRDADVVVGCFMGNEYNQLAILIHPEPFDFELPDSTLPVSEGAAIIPYPMMHAVIKKLADENALLIFRKLAESTDKPVLLLPPPPPIADPDHIRKFPGAFGERLKKYEVAPLPFRIKMWTLYCSILRDATSEFAHTRMIELPSKVFKEGALAPQYWSDDPTHGNPIYGDVLLEHIVELARHVKKSDAKVAS